MHFTRLIFKFGLLFQILVEGARPSTGDVIQASGTKVSLSSVHADTVTAMQPSGAMVRESRNREEPLNASNPSALLQAEPASDDSKQKADDDKAKNVRSAGTAHNPNQVGENDPAFEDDMAQSGSRQMIPENFDDPDPEVFGDMPPTTHGGAFSPPRPDEHIDVDVAGNNLGRAGGMPHEDVDSEEAARRDVDESQDEDDIPNSAPVGNYPEVSDAAIRGRQLFSATAAHASDLLEAKKKVENTMTKVEKAISNTNKATNTYHESINRLSSNFGKLHVKAAGVHADLLNELRQREAKRMCAFANVDRRLKNEPELPCDAVSLPKDFSVHHATVGTQTAETLASAENVETDSAIHDESPQVIHDPTNEATTAVDSDGGSDTDS